MWGWLFLIICRGGEGRGDGYWVLLKGVDGWLMGGEGGWEGEGVGMSEGEGEEVG